MAVQLVIKEVSRQIQTDRLKILLTGETGVGKTLVATSAPEPIFVFDYDGRMAPVIRFHKGRNIKYVTVTCDNFFEASEYLDRLVDNCPYATVILDSFTFFTIVAVAIQIQMRSGATGKKTKGGIEIPGFDEYNGETMAATTTLEALKQLPCHVIVTAHPVTKTTMQGGKSLVSRTITSYGQKIASVAPGYFDEIYHIGIQSAIGPSDPVRRLLHTQHIGSDFARTALNLPGEIDITNRFDVFDHIISLHNSREEADALITKLSSPTNPIMNPSPITLK